MQMASLKIILADDHRLVAEALTSLLKKSFDLVSTVHDGRALVEEILRIQPDVAVSDVFMPTLNGLDALRQIRSKGNQTKMIFLTMHTDPALVAEAFQAGASGFVSKECAGDELIYAINEVAHGRRYLTPLAGEDLLSILMNARSRVSSADVLRSPRQRQILQLIAEGKTLKEIGVILDISPRTVETHKYEMMETLGAKSTAELIRWALRLNLIPPQEIKHD